MGAFLSLHPTVVELHPPPPSVPASDPLHKFSGPGNIARAMVPNSQIAHVTISWDRRIENEFPEVLAAISKTQEPLQILHNFFRVWDPALLLIIKNHLPHLTNLEFRNISSRPPANGDTGGKDPGTQLSLRVLLAELQLRRGSRCGSATYQAFYDALEPLVAGLPSLEVLCCFSHSANLALEFRIVRACQARSTALRGCLLAVWSRVEGNMWHPEAVDPDEADANWRFRWLIARVAAAPAELPDYADNMAQVLGVDS
ncbi:hypothetical protein B0H16DRAFT_1455870 [Mycena metata]|uniref:Uncharacterized protein n=1 Tax=Mycena metata TaxID=1033252 RepID=A0AAD7JFU4_9AGAR|nr:hypothetical protein B0H16DRAFT_1455870 [Mycena metata]